MSDNADMDVDREGISELVWMVGLLTTSMILLYFGRGVVLHQGAFLSGGFGGIGVLLGGGTPQEANAVYQAVQRPEPTLIESVFFYSGVATMFLNVIMIRTGFLLTGENNE